MNAGYAPRVAVVPVIGADGAGKTTLHGALAAHVAHRDGLSGPPVRGVAVGAVVATVLDVRMPSCYLQLVDFPNIMAQQQLLGTAPCSAALLVVSALDSVVPGTRSSVARARELGIPSVVVALTRCEMVADPEMLDLVQMEIREMLERHEYPGATAPVLAVSTSMVHPRHGSPVVPAGQLLDAVASLTV